MSLIKCIECNNEVSDKAITCPHCGFPLKSNNNNVTNNNELYDIVFVEFIGTPNHMLVKGVLEEIYGLPKGQYWNKTKESGSILIEGIKQENLQELKKVFLSYKCIVDSIPSKTKYIHPKNSIIEEWKQQDKTKPKCPTCGSTNIEKISTSKKVKGSLLFGVFSSDIRNTMHCKNCGYKW